MSIHACLCLAIKKLFMVLTDPLIQQVDDQDSDSCDDKSIDEVCTEFFTLLNTKLLEGCLDEVPPCKGDNKAKGGGNNAHKRVLEFFCDGRP